MPDYRRLWIPGGTYFFTVNLLERRGNDLLVRKLDLFKHAVVDTARWRRFRIDAWVVLPEHLHCIATLPPGDSDFASRWRRIKKTFTKQIPATEHRSATRHRRGERGIWQRRYWEHLIRDENDYRNHVDYIHYNPVKHDLVQRASDWPHSSLHRHIQRGLLPHDWSAPP
jgi:putative transposase